MSSGLYQLGCAGDESISRPNSYWVAGLTDVVCLADTAMWPHQSNGGWFWDSVVNMFNINFKSASVVASTVALSFCSSLNDSPSWMVIAGGAGRPLL